MKYTFKMLRFDRFTGEFFSYVLVNDTDNMAYGRNIIADILAALFESARAGFPPSEFGKSDAVLHKVVEKEVTPVRHNILMPARDVDIDAETVPAIVSYRVNSCVGIGAYVGGGISAFPFHGNSPFCCPCLSFRILCTYNIIIRGVFQFDKRKNSKKRADTALTI